MQQHDKELVVYHVQNYWVRSVNNINIHHMIVKLHDYLKGVLERSKVA